MLFQIFIPECMDEVRLAVSHRLLERLANKWELEPSWDSWPCFYQSRIASWYGQATPAAGRLEERWNAESIVEFLVDTFRRRHKKFIFSENDVSRLISQLNEMKSDFLFGLLAEKLKVPPAEPCSTLPRAIAAIVAELLDCPACTLRHSNSFLVHAVVPQGVLDQFNGEHLPTLRVRYATLSRLRQNAEAIEQKLFMLSSADDGFPGYVISAAKALAFLDSRAGTEAVRPGGFFPASEGRCALDLGTTRACAQEAVLNETAEQVPTTTDLQTLCRDEGRKKYVIWHENDRFERYTETTVFEDLVANNTNRYPRKFVACMQERLDSALSRSGGSALP